MTLRIPTKELRNANKAIEHAIDNLEFSGRGPVARSVLGDLRHLVEHVAMCTVHGGKNVPGDYFSEAKAAIKQMGTAKDTRFIADFHIYLQEVVSHYVPTEDSSERLLLKYYEYLILLKHYAANALGIQILGNLDKIPLDTDPGLDGYHREIANRVDRFTHACSPSIGNDRFYVRGVKPFFVDGRVYYEITLVPAYDSSSKYDHVLVFSSFRIPSNNAVRVSTKNASVHGLGSSDASLPIVVVDGYEASIRPCEINALLKVFGLSDAARVSGLYMSYRSLMAFLTRTGMTLCELASLPSPQYELAMETIGRSGSACPVHALLNSAHSFLVSNARGGNVLRYLLSKPRNRVIKGQLACVPNEKLGGLYLQYGCIPFENQPYCTSLLGHEVAIEDLYCCIDPEPYKDNLLAGWVARESLKGRTLYVKDDDAASRFGDIDALIARYNDTLYRKHASRRIEHEKGRLFVKGDEDDVVAIINGLLELSATGIKGYSSTCAAWLAKNQGVVDDPAKVAALETIFADAKAALVYGSAGTGKTTMVNYVCSILDGVRKIAIANTNPAVDSLRRKIRDGSCSFQTVAKYLAHPTACDLLIVDECSTVCNRDMRKIIDSGCFKLLMLVGDERQSESIRFGNWFSLAREFLPKKCVHEFEKPWRTTNDGLLKLWDSVRSMRPNIAEILAACDATAALDGSVLERMCSDEIVLCLNYDGLYGINSLNRLLQSLNPNPSVFWNLHTYKVGDPILFSETERFRPLLYNNLKGWIVDIDQNGRDTITFVVAVDIMMSELSVFCYQGLEFVDARDGKTYLRFTVHRPTGQDEEDPGDDCVVPFQVAYAVSVHKAQGLEYSSVKLVITKDVESRITHSVFYTAITRARESLRIYWSPESQNKVLSGFELASSYVDARILSSRCGLTFRP